MNTKGWSPVFFSGTDYEAEIVCERLKSADIPAVVLSQRDHAFNLTHGFLAKVHVMVPDELVKRASSLLDETPPTDDELAQAALGATDS